MTLYITEEAGPSGTQRSPSPTQVADAVADGSIDSDDEIVRRTLYSAVEEEDDDDVSDSEDFASRLQQRQMNVFPGSRTNTLPFRVPAAQAVYAHITPSTPANRPPNVLSGREFVGGANSGSSQGSVAFPSPGTRARTVKDHLEREEKQTPYKPPRGTRAALLQV